MKVTSNTFVSKKLVKCTGHHNEKTGTNLTPLIWGLTKLELKYVLFLYRYFQKNSYHALSFFEEVCDKTELLCDKTELYV